jgi:hypothetical protein
VLIYLVIHHLELVKRLLSFLEVLIELLRLEYLIVALLQGIVLIFNELLLTFLGAHAPRLNLPSQSPFLDLWVLLSILEHLLLDPALVCRTLAILLPECFIGRIL